MKKLLASLLCIAMITVYMPAAVWADTGNISVSDKAAFEEAINKASIGTTIILDNNIDLSGVELTIAAEKDITIDLAGHTLTTDKVITVNGKLTIEDSTATNDPVISPDYEDITYSAGAIKNKNPSRDIDAVVIEVRDGGSLVHNSGTLESVKNYTVAVYGQTSAEKHSAVINSTATVNGGYQIGQEGGPAVFGNGAVLNVTGGVIVGRDNSAVAGNGTVKADKDFGGTTINISGGTLIGHITTTDYIANGIYHPQAGQLNITGGTIYADGGVGVLVRAGSVNITGGEIISTGTNEGFVGDNTKTKIPCSGIVFDEASAYPGLVDTDQISISGNTAINSEYNSCVKVVSKDSAEQSDRISVTGGTFSDISAKAYVPEGTELEQNEETGKYELAPASDAVAQVGNAGYTDLQEAIDRAGENDTVRLLENYQADKAITVAESKSIVLELNGRKLTLSGQGNYRDDEITSAEYIYGMINKGTLTIQNGEIIVDGEMNGIVNTGALTIASDARISDNASSYAKCKLVVNFGGEVVTSGELTSLANDGLTTFGGTVNITGGKISAKKGEDGSNAGSSLTIFNRGRDNNSKGANVTISGGTLESAAFAASTNNLLSGGKNASNLTITGGTLFSKHTTAVYWPSAGVLTIGDKESGNGPSITSANGSAIEICSGTLNVYGGALNGGTEMSDADSKETSQDWVDAFRKDSGSWGLGDAITVIARRGKGYVMDPVNVNIVGGQFNSSQNYGIRYMDCNLATGADELWQEVSVEITGGDFSGKLAPVDAKFMQTKEQKFISGGTFSGDLPEEYLSEGMDTYGRANGKFTVAEKTPQGQIPDIDPTPGYEWVQDENGNYVEQKIPTPPATVQKPEIIVDDGAKAELSSLGTTAAITVEEGYELVDVTLNGVSLGKVTTVTGLKTGDKLVITTQKKLTDEEKDLIEAVESAAIDASTVLGDGYIRVNWTTAGTTEMDYYEIYRSTERDGDYGDTPYFTTKHGRLSGWYKNTKELEKGTCYYYKVRGVKEINGEKYSTPWSDIGYRAYKEIGKGVRNTTIKAWSSAGKGYIRVQWRKSAGYRVDYYEVYRTAKRGSWEDAAYFKTKEGGMSGWYKNTKELKKGTRYYYKVRGVKELDGKKVYTRWSTLAYRIAQ